MKYLPPSFSQAKSRKSSQLWLAQWTVSRRGGNVYRPFLNNSILKQFVRSGGRQPRLQQTDSRLDQWWGRGGCRKAGAADCGIEANSFVAIYSVRNSAQSDTGVCAEREQRARQCLAGRRSPTQEQQRTERIDTKHSRKSRKLFFPHKKINK